MKKEIKKLLTIEDLIRFCETTNFSQFNSIESGYRLAVHVPAIFEQIDTDENEKNDHVGMLKLKVKIFHTGLNRNGSYISEKAAKEAMPTINNRPILAYIHQLENGSWDFKGHEMVIEKDKDGNDEIVYLEQQVGSFGAEDAFFEYDEKNNVNFVCAYAYIPEEYTRASSIIKEKGSTKNSVELSVGELAYNAKDKYLELKSFYISGSTLLGRTYYGEEIQEGMLGSRADIIDFSTDMNSTIEKSKYISDFNINSIKEKEGKRQMNFKKILEKYHLDEDDITFKYSGMSEIEFEEKIKKFISQDSDPDEEEIEEDTTEGTDNVEDKDPSDEIEDEDPNSEIDESEDEEDNEDAEISANMTIDYSMNFNGVTRTFSLTLSDIQYKLADLVNTTYAGFDNVWFYNVIVYIDDNYVIMEGFRENEVVAYKQTFSREEDEFELTGDRVEVHSIWLTDNEESELNNIRSNFSDISEKLQKYKEAEENAEKINILNSNDYEMVHDEPEYKKLFKTYMELTVKEVKEQCDSILLQYVKSNQQNIKDEIEKKKSFSVTPLPSTQKKKSRYGNLFSK